VLTLPPPKTAGVYASLRAAGKKADLSLVVADEPAVAGGVFTKNVMCAAPVLYCKDVLARQPKVKAVSWLVSCTAGLSCRTVGLQGVLTAADQACGPHCAGRQLASQAATHHPLAVTGPCGAGDDQRRAGQRSHRHAGV
jgi:N-acetylglutamate synthase/N-acetylornithine aminotransferase